MAYGKKLWLDHVVERPRTYTETVNSDGSKTFADAPGEIIQQGTPLSAENFNHAEEGLQDVAAALDALYSYIMVKLARSAYTLDTLDAAKLGVNDNAASATKLKTARTIALTGKATATGVAFDGSGNISINVTALDPSGLSAATPVAKGGTGATTAETARSNLGAVSQTVYDSYVKQEAQDTRTMAAAFDLLRSIQQMDSRSQASRIATLEAQVAALTT